MKPRTRPCISAAVAGLVLASCGANVAERPSRAAPPERRALRARTELSLDELQRRPGCRWRSLPARIYFDCESSALSSAEELSPEALAEVLELLERDETILAVKVFGYYSPNQEVGRDDLALERARELASAVRERAGVIVVAESFGAAPATTYPEPCVREGAPEARRHVERFATFGVLRCAPDATRTRQP